MKNNYKTTIYCQRLNINVSANKEFAIIEDGNSLYNIEKFIKNNCMNEKNCQNYDRCKISDFKPINE